MLCPDCGKFQGYICFPPTPTCQCDKDKFWRQWVEEYFPVLKEETCCGDPSDCNDNCFSS